MKKVLFLSNHFITLYNFRRELIEKLLKDGHEVYISFPRSDSNKYFSDMGCKIIETEVDRRGINPVKDITLFFNYIKILKTVKPDIIFSYTIKPNIYGSMASNITRYKQISNITGTGGTFLKKGLINSLVKLLYRISVKHSYKVFFQNNGDKDFFVENKMVKDNYDVLPGSGVNLNQFEFTPLPEGECINIAFIGRVMKIKGIEEFIKAAEIVRSKYKNINFIIAGFIEEKDCGDLVKKSESEGIIEYVGFLKDVVPFIRSCHCTVLPSHGGEGIPNSLLETTALGRFCIASDICGSQDVIENNKTGYLFNVGQAEELAEKIEQFVNMSTEEQNRVCIAGRNRIENYFNREIVIKKYISEVENVRGNNGL